MHRVKIGVMGVASIAERLMIPAILNLPEHFELRAIASRTLEKVQHLATNISAEAIVGYENLLLRTDIDAIYMPLPTGLHNEWIQKALNAGKHVLVEKSLAMDYNSAKALVELAQSKNLLLMENFMFRYHSQHQLTLKMLENDEMGEVRLFRSQFGFPPLDKNNFRYNKDLGGGALLDAAAYTVRVAQWFFGNKQEILEAVLYIDNNDVDIYGNVTLMSDKKIISQLSFGFDNYYRCNYEIWGSKAVLTAEKAFTPKPNESPSFLLEQAGKVNRVQMTADNHFENILKEFHHSISHHTYQEHFDDILNQSHILTNIRNKSIKIRI